MSNIQQGEGLKNPIESLLGYRLRRASVEMMADLAAGLHPVGMSPVQATILMLIDANPGCRQRDLCDALAIKRTNMTPHISALMASGIIDRSAMDGRSHALFLTDEGRTLTARIGAIIAEHERRFEAGMTDANRSLLLDALRTVERIGRARPEES